MAHQRGMTSSNMVRIIMPILRVIMFEGRQVKLKDAINEDKWDI